MLEFDRIRSIPLRRPPNFSPPVKRYALAWPDRVEQTITVYFGVQAGTKEIAEASSFRRHILESLLGKYGPGSFEQGYFVDKEGCYNLVVVAYWLDPGMFERWEVTASFVSWWADSRRLNDGVGYWRETLRVPPERMETLYAYPDYKVGLARCEPSSFDLVKYNGYFGAMRDRIPLCAVDALNSPLDRAALEPRHRSTREARWVVHAPSNLTVIRSGQYWEKCGEEQRSDYFLNMRPLLERGTEYLGDHVEESGCLSMRLCRNLERCGRERDESFNHAYFLSLGHLEEWSASHRTHLAIWRHAISMMKKYGERRELRTWHEVYVLPEGGQRFEYLNCHAQTGLLPYFDAHRIG